VKSVLFFGPEIRYDHMPEIVKTEKLVEYQKGAVVSRTLINKPAGTVTVFSFDKGEGLSEHTAPYDALVQVLDGKAEITIDGEPHNLGRGDMVIMPANSTHALRAVERFKMMLVMVKG
jgi:quercetin dioxygenase-like cupin family protein